MARAGEDGLIPVAVRWLTERWGAAPVVGAVLVDHARRAVFRTERLDGSPVAVKVSRDRGQAQREMATLHAARALGLPVPAVLDRCVSGSGPVAILVLEWVRGRPLREVSDPAAWAAAGQALRRLHDVPARGPVAPAAWCADMVAELAGDVAWMVAEGMADPRHAAQWQEAARAGFADEVRPMAWLHGDAQGEHVLVAPDAPMVVGIVDFGDAGPGDPAWDLAVLTLDAPDRLSDVLHGYGSHADERHRQRGVIPAFWVARRLGELRWRAERGFAMPPSWAADLDRLAGWRSGSAGRA